MNISFAFTLIQEVNETLGAGNYDDDDVYKITFKFYDASTNTRAFTNPYLIDNKKDVEKFIMDCQNERIIDKATSLRPDSKWKFFDFVYVRFDVYELNSAIGKINELPQHLKKDQMKKV